MSREATYLDCDYVSTVFSGKKVLMRVVGPVHPPNYVLVYPKYVESSEPSPWRGYLRLVPRYSPCAIYDAALRITRELNASLMKYDPYWNSTVPLLDKRKIREHFLPEVRLAEIIREARGLETYVRELVLELVDNSSARLSYIGVTGSILLKIHNEKLSDIDIVVYEPVPPEEVRQAISTLKDQGLASSLSPDDIALKAREKAESYGIPFEKAVELYKRRVELGLFKGRQFSICYVRRSPRRWERYGCRSFRFLSPIELTCEIIDNADSYSLTGRLIVNNVRILQGPDLKPSEIILYDSFFLGLFSVGERVRVKGLAAETSDGELVVLVGTHEVGGYVIPGTS